MIGLGTKTNTKFDTINHAVNYGYNLRLNQNIISGYSYLKASTGSSLEALLAG